MAMPENNIKDSNGEFNSELWGTQQRNKSKQSMKLFQQLPAPEFILIAT